ncbi:hypothetical protein FACS189450_08820 [Spirochaetia bacterium]|nr:hypothetical protein FACS189450_08820 [Spirochaetia bacterium]
MVENKIELKSINKLIGMKFFIPSYQRGYRWDVQQVKDLLNDIQEFIDKKQDGFYCIQPLVVRKNLLEYTKWEVIDGQQRLTTIYILLSYLNSQLNFKDKYFIEYETRIKSKLFLENIDPEERKVNIDYHHIVEANEIIECWFDKKDDDMKNKFRDILLNKVKFIWYESIDEDPVKVFTRLNIGKISLTNAELIKALFLNKSNFQGDDYPKIKLRQQEIAGEWDAIEYTLQNDEFWLFLNKAGYDRPTRIDFIFDLVCKKNILEQKDYQEKIGTDDYKTFRYFYEWFKQTNDDKKKFNCWKRVKDLFRTFQEWSNDLELYHYIGFLIEQNVDIMAILDNWNKKNQTKQCFKDDYLFPAIRSIIAIKTDKDIENIEALKYGNNKDRIRPILLLHNIQSIINQNSTLVNNEKYKLPVFYKFPFHLFKKETWDVEHIDSNTENPLMEEAEQKEWLRSSSIGINDETLLAEIKTFLQPTPLPNLSPESNDSFDSNMQTTFDVLHMKIMGYKKQTEENKLNEEKGEKQKLWNLTLLDASTNRSYGNAIFPSKRRIIIGKNQGKTITVNDNLEVREEPGAIAFIPPCTMNVFVKYNNIVIDGLSEWDRRDANSYLDDIKSVLKVFLKKGEDK